MTADRTTSSALSADVAHAVTSLSALVQTQRAGDETYFRNQLSRYTRAVTRIREMRTSPCRVLDIGSHYLHQSVLLSELGFEVFGIDIGLFTNASFVQERAARFKIRNETVNVLETGDFLPGMEGKFDLIVFTEILEHITFNPVRFWRRIYELMSPSGVVYLSTPNSLRPAAIVRQIANLATWRGIGISLDEIMQTVTYGHHWKEYSAWEIRRYFSMLSSDFSVETRWYSSDLDAHTGIKGQLKRVIALVPCFRSDIEALVTRAGAAGFSADVPRLRMQTPPPPTNA